MPGDLASEIRRALDENTPAVIAARDEAGVIFVINSVEVETHTDGDGSTTLWLRGYRY